MERIAVNPERLRWACDDRGVSGDQLAEIANAGAKTIAKALAGEDALTFGQLRSVAKFFNRGVLFFVENGPVREDSLRTPQFRTLANQKPDMAPELRALIERAEQHREIYLGLREELDPEDRERFKPPKVGGLTAINAAAVARKWLGLQEQNDFESYRAAVEARNVLVFMGVGYLGAWRLPAESPVVGFSIFDPRCPVILVKKSRGDARQVFTLMHELGHVLLHQSSFIDEEQDFYASKGREREANLFAGHLLVPDSFLQSIHGERNGIAPEEIDAWLDSWRRRWGVSSDVILLRLIEAGRLKWEVYERYHKWKASLPISQQEGGSREWRHREPLHLFGNRYVRTVLDAMNAERVSLNKASGFLDNIKVSDVRKLEAHVAGL